MLTLFIVRATQHRGQPDVLLWPKRVETGGGVTVVGKRHEKKRTNAFIEPLTPPRRRRGRHRRNRYTR